MSTTSQKTPRQRVGAIIKETVARHPILSYGGIVALIIGQVAALLVPKLTGMAIDSVRSLEALVEFRQDDQLTRWARSLLGIPADSPLANHLDTLIWAIAIGSVIIAILQYLKRRAMTGLSRIIEYDLRRVLFGHLQRLQMRFYAEMRSGDVISRATSDVEATRMMTGPAMMYIGEAAVLLPLTLYAMATISVDLMLWALLPLGLLTLSVLFFSPRQRQHSLDLQERQADLSARAQENFSGARVVKAFTRENFESEQFDALSRRVYLSSLGLAVNRTAFQSTIWTLNGAGLLVFLYFGAHQIADGALSLGQFIEFTLYFGMLYWPMIALGWVILLIVRGRVSAARINEILDQEPDAGVGDQGIVPAQLSGRIVFENVSFGYEPDTMVVRDLSFEVPAGKTLAIVGPVGSGKTSVARLLLRLREPDSGKISIDGYEIQELAPDALRAQIGFVPQETFLFSESIAENIAFGLEQEVREQSEHAASVAQIRNEIAELPRGFDTMLGERGVNLSGGQKQRTAIARALVGKPKIVILDDALSAVDTKTEEAILSGLKRELAATTTILIAQRVSTVAHADEILVLADGAVVERGTDAELRKLGGLYAEMATNQSLQKALQE